MVSAPRLVLVDDGEEKANRLSKLLSEYDMDRSFLKASDDTWDARALADSVLKRVEEPSAERSEVWLVDVFYQGERWKTVGARLRQAASARKLAGRVDEIRRQLDDKEYLAASLIALLECYGKRFALWSRVHFSTSLPMIPGEVPLGDTDGARSATLRTIRDKLNLVLAPRFGQVLKRIRSAKDRHRQCQNEEPTRVRDASFLATDDWQEFLKEVSGVRDRCTVGALLLAGHLSNPDRVESSDLNSLVKNWHERPLSLIATRWTDSVIDSYAHADRTVDAWLRLFSELCAGAKAPLGVQVTRQSASIVTHDAFGHWKDRIRRVLVRRDARDHSLSRALIEFLGLTSWRVLPERVERTAAEAIFRVEVADGRMLIGFEATTQS